MHLKCYWIFCSITRLISKVFNNKMINIHDHLNKFQAEHLLIELSKMNDNHGGSSASGRSTGSRWQSYDDYLDNMISGMRMSYLTRRHGVPDQGDSRPVVISSSRTTRNVTSDGNQIAFIFFTFCLSLRKCGMAQLQYF